ncbi:MAG: DNA polymerase III subunit delta [Bacillota bacterium]|nr:DNA polymerase III subunit delta [Bacillota bacterium]
MREREEHAFIRIEKALKADKIPAAVLLCGTEEYLVHHYADTLINTFTNKASQALDLVTLDRDTVTFNSIVENLETMPLMSERKVVYLPDFIDTKGKMPKAFEDKDEAQKLADYIMGQGVGSSDPLLLMTVARQADQRVDQAVRRSVVFKAFSPEGIYDFDTLDDAQLRGFIEKRFRSCGKQYRPGIISLIVREGGYGNKNIDYGLFNLENDLRKIIAHSGSNPEIMPEDVSSVLTVNPENNIFAMIDAISRNRKDEAFRLLHNLLTGGSSEFQLLAMITRQLELMLTTCELKESGLNLPAIQKEMKRADKVHEFRTQKALEMGSRFGRTELKRILASAYEVEPNIKTGLMPGPLALEYFIAGI